MSCSDNYHILLAIVTGERCYISDQLYDRVKDAGVSHVLVVSGMHLVLLCTGLERLLRIIFKSGILRDFLLISFVLMMSVVCGFGMSILRAAIVYVLRVIYRRIGRRANGIHSLSFAVVLVLIIHPYAFHSISFQLSYSATLGILVLPKIINKKLEKYTKNSFILTKVADIMSISLSAYIATLPVCIAAFGELSVVAVAVNVLLDIPANAMLSLCVIGLALGFIPFLEKVFMILADALGDYFIKIVNVASNLPFAKLRLRNEKILVVVLLLCYLALYVTKTKPYRILKKR
jgi:competence protein ComEC